MNIPEVTIVIPAYNPGAYLKIALDSVVAQAFTRWEAIVVDDGSPEDLSWVDQFHPQVRRIRQSNAGQAIARNAGIIAAAGKYVAFLDQDDLWEPAKLQRQVAMLEADSTLTMCHTQFDIVDGDGKFKAEGFGRQQDYHQMLEGSGIAGASTLLMHRAAVMRLGLFDPMCQPAEDYDLAVRMARFGKIGFIPSIEAHYRIHAQNQSLKYRNTYRCIVAILNKNAELARRTQDRQGLRAQAAGKKNIGRTYAWQAVDCARQLVRKRRFIAAISELWFGFRLKPSVVMTSCFSWIKGIFRR